MPKVEILVFGKRALVDADQVAKLQKKEMLVKQAMALKEMAAPAIEIQDVMSKIIRLNRTIRQNVQFIY